MLSSVYDYHGHVVVFTSKRGFICYSGFMPPLHLCSSDRNVTGGECAIATREKTAVLLSMDEHHCLHYVLYVMQLSVAHKQSLSCCNLTPRDLLDSFFDVDY